MRYAFDRQSGEATVLDLARDRHDRLFEAESLRFLEPRLHVGCCANRA